MSSPDWHRRGGQIVLALCFVIGLVMLGLHLRPVPQIGSDPEVFRTVDALFTAITSRNRLRTEECEKRLMSDREQGKLPPKSAIFLDSVIAEARSGNWASAARRLYDFMLAQRGETSS